MNSPSNKKINHLLSTTPKGIVLLSSWLKANGYSSSLVKRYRNSGWLKSIGVGANIRVNDNVDYFGALYTLQTQQKSSVHIGARSAFSILGKSHYLELNIKKVILFAANNDSCLPTWFKNYEWKVNIEFHSSDFITQGIGLIDVKIKEFNIKVSNEIRALMECLLLVPNQQELIECYELMESMNNLSPKNVQELLEHCRSIKVKRLFLYLSEKAGHEWFNYLDISKLDLGVGKRKIIDEGFLEKKYQITLPKFWKNND